MVKLEVQVCATLENLSNLRLNEDDEWNFKVKCSQCNEEFPNVIYFNLVEKQSIEGSKGEASFVAKCKFCSKSGNIDYCKNTMKGYSSSENYQTIAMFECRNLEITAFIAGADMKATGTQADGETEFDGIDLANEPDWAGFDEEGDCSVGVYDFKTQVIRSNKK